MIRAMVMDGDGKLVPLVGFMRHAGMVFRGPLPRPVERRVGKEVDRYITRHAGWRVVLSLGAAALASKFLALACVLVLTERFGYGFLPSSIAVFCAMWLLGFVFIRRLGSVVKSFVYSREVCQFAAASIVSAGCCASCGFPLSSGAVEDEMVRCTECGATWRRSGESVSASADRGHGA